MTTTTTTPNRHDTGNDVAEAQALAQNGLEPAYDAEPLERHVLYFYFGLGCNDLVWVQLVQ